MRSSVEIFGVELIGFNNDQLRGHFIDTPRAGIECAANDIEVSGWVLGHQGAAVAVEIVHKGTVIRRALVNIRRPDVAAAYPDVVGAELSGFCTILSVLVIHPLELGIRAVLQDQNRVPMGVIRLRRYQRDRGSGDGASLVSVIIPCYNQAHFLGEAIESVLGQTYQYFDLVVVDDGATDNTSEVAARYPGIRCIRQVNRGLAAARNAGVENSCGDYLLFLDADDRLLPAAIEQGLAAFKDHPECAFVAGHYRIIAADGTLLEEPPPRWVGRDHYADLLRRNFIAMHATVMYKREAFDFAGGFNPSHRACEDYDLYLRIAKQRPIYCYPQVVAEYRQHGANTTRNPTLMLEAASSVLRSQWSHVEGNPRYEEAYRAGIRFWQGYYRAQSARQNVQLAIVEIFEVKLCETSEEQLWGRNLEAPQPGSEFRGDNIEIIGWVLGRQTPAVAVEVVENGRVRQRLQLDIERQDVAAHYPNAVSSSESGFHGWVDVHGLQDIDLLVQAVLQDDTRVPTARIRARQHWRRLTDDSKASLVSVIIPCYNQAHYLGEAIESALAQSYWNTEVVVVDDGSTDNTSEVAGGYLGEVRCIRQENQGLAAARNAGLDHSCGDYVIFLDADDRLTPEAIAVGVAEFEAQPDCALVAGQYRLIGGHESILEEPPPHPITRDHYAELLRHNHIRVPATVMYRRAVFENVGNFDPSVSPCADYDLYLRMARQFPIRCHEHIIAEYRQHASNMTGNPGLMLQSVLRAHRSQRKKIRGHREFEKAYAVGQTIWKDYYGEQLVDEMRTRVRRGEWMQAMNGLVTLLAYHPRGFLSLMFDDSSWRRMREIVRAVLPSTASIIIVGGTAGIKHWKHGSHRILEFASFEYQAKADSDIVDSGELIHALERLRSQGGEFLLIPSSYFWYLQHFGDFYRYLEANFRRVWTGDQCILYQITVPALETKSSNLKNLLVCPVCKGTLHFSTVMIRCLSCQSSFPQLGTDCIDLLPEPCSANDATRWIERQQEMETWYRRLIVNSKQAQGCFLHDYSPIAPILATLSGMILDVGGGIGLVRQYLPQGATYIVIDPSLSWLEAEWSCLANHFPCLRTRPAFVRGVGERLPFPAQTFNAVLACWSLNHAWNPEEVFREAWRVLREGGRFLAILEEISPGKQDMAELSPQPCADKSSQSGKPLVDNGVSVQNDHIGILESDIATWILGSFEVINRSWIGEYLTFEFRKI